MVQKFCRVLEPLEYYGLLSAIPKIWKQIIRYEPFDSELDIESKNHVLVY